MHVRVERPLAAWVSGGARTDSVRPRIGPVSWSGGHRGVHEREIPRLWIRPAPVVTRNDPASEHMLTAHLVTRRLRTSMPAPQIDERVP